MAYRLARRARTDVAEIWSHIAADDEAAADRFVERLVSGFRVLGRNPRAGRRWDDLRAGYRSFPVGEYLIFYRIADPGVRILHIVHGRRNITALLGE